LFLVGVSVVAWILFFFFYTTKSPTTFIDTTANGVDLINIANPNSVGVSIKNYSHYNQSH
jgi:hypothetical protein